MTGGIFPGGALRKRRELRGMTLQQASEATRVTMQHLAALEAGNLNALPGPTYTRGFITSYCHVLELDPEPFLDRYRACLPPAPRLRAATSVSLDLSSPARPRWVGEAMVWGGICAFLLLAWLTYAAMVQPFAKDSGARVEAGVEIRPPQAHFEDDL
jgi:cytoskeleton protein RodZ